MRLGVLLILVPACGRIDFDATRVGDGALPNDARPVDAAPDAGCTSFGAFAAPQVATALNSPATDWGPTLSHDQLAILFASDRGGSAMQLYEATRMTVAAAWSTPQPLGITGGDPSLSTDELTLYWGDGAGVATATRAATTDPWTVLGDLPISGSDFTVAGGPDISPDGLTLLFTGTAVADGLWHEYVATRAAVTDEFTTATELASIATTAGEAYGSMRGDGLEIVYQDEATQKVLSHALRAATADAFGSGTPIAELNSADDGDMVGDADLSDDGTTIWYTVDESSGGYDLWWSTRPCT